MTFGVLTPNFQCHDIRCNTYHCDDLPQFNDRGALTCNGQDIMNAVNTIATLSSPPYAYLDEGLQLYVINLCTSITPAPSLPQTIKGLDAYFLYQISQLEEGRHRYRIRLGFFTSMSDAELAVCRVHRLYPAAFVTRISAEDQRFFGQTTQPSDSSDMKNMITPAVLELAPEPTLPTESFGTPQPHTAHSFRLHAERLSGSLSLMPDSLATPDLSTHVPAGTFSLTALSSRGYVANTNHPNPAHFMGYPEQPTEHHLKR